MQEDTSINYISSHKTLNKGLLLIERGLYKHAIEYFVNELSINPNNHLIFYYLSICYYHLNKPKEGLESGFKAIELNPEFYPAYENVSWLYFSLKKDYLNAEKFALKALNINPNDANIYALLGQIYFFSRKYNLSYECTSHSLNLDPQNYIAHLISGIYYYEFKNFKQSEKHLLKCLELAPNSPAGYLNYGLLNIEFARTSRGYHLLKEAIKLNPEEQFYQKCFKKAFIINHLLYYPIRIIKLDQYFPHYLATTLFGIILSSMMFYIETIKTTHTLNGLFLASLFILLLLFIICLSIYKYLISIILNLFYTNAVKKGTLHKII